MKNALLIAGAGVTLALAGCSSTGNSGSPGDDYGRSSGSAVSTRGETDPGNPTTNPEGGWQSWRFHNKIDPSQNTPPGAIPPPDN